MRKETMLQYKPPNESHPSLLHFNLTTSDSTGKKTYH